MLLFCIREHFIGRQILEIGSAEAEYLHNLIQQIQLVNSGIIRSPLQGKIGVENADDLASLHLLNRIGEAEEIANVVYYLANSNFVTGEIINVDGGHVAGHAFG